MTVTAGMDTARARSTAQQLKSEGATLAGLGEQGSALSKVLQDVWGGPDAERFAREWQAARPAIAGSSRDLVAFADELTHQADEQDRASGGDGGRLRAELPGGGSGGGSRPSVGGAPDLEPAPLLEPMTYPLEVPAGWKAITKTISELWDVYTSPIFGTIETVVNEVVDRVLDRIDLTKYKGLSKIFKGLGVVGGLVSVVLGQIDMFQAVKRLFTEGFSVDAVLQFVEGWTGWASGGLGIAALFAGGTVFGLPLAFVFGAGAVVLGVISLGIGFIREYGPWFKEVAEGDPAWTAKVGQEGGLRHGWELPERNARVPRIYKASDRRDAMGVPVGA